MRSIDGEPVTDAATRVRVDVTKRDIENGAPMNPNSCAIAVACVRQLDGVTDAYVHLGRVFLLRNGKWRRYYLPRYGRDEIVAYDRGGKFVPQQIELLPPPVETLIKKTRRSSAVRSGPKRKRVIHHTPEVRHTAHANLPERTRS